MLKVRWVMYGFCSNFYTFQHYQIFGNHLRYDKITDSLKVGIFSRHSVEILGYHMALTV